MQSLLFSTLCLKLVWILSSWTQSWTTEGVYYGKLGSNVTLACGTSPQRSPVQWRVNHSSVLPWHHVTIDGSLVLFNVNQSAQGNYSCHEDQGPALNTVSLLLGYPPGTLNVSCRVPSHAYIRCSWDRTVHTFLPAQYYASYRGVAAWPPVGRPCVVDSAQRYCDIYQPNFWQTTHEINITVANPLGAKATYTKFKLHQLLKPDPPEGVVVVGQPSFPTRLRVSWLYPLTWPPLQAFPLLFQIRYRPHGSTHWAQIESTETTVVVLDVLAGHPHQVQVRAQDEANTDSHWSDWSPLLLAWPWGGKPHNTSPVTTTEPPYLSMETLPSEVFPGDPFSVEPFSSKGNAAGEEETLSLVILLVLFSIFIIIIILSLTVVMCMRHRRHHVTKQEVSSMLKMKAIPL